MEELLQNVEWVTVLVSFILCFGLGWLWYSPAMFYERWRVGKGGEVWAAPMWMPMSAQIGSTLLFAIIMNLSAVHGEIAHGVLVGVTIAGFIKANGLYSGKTKYAIMVEAGYVIAMTIVMVLMNVWM